MATVAFTPTLERYLAAPARPVEAASVRDECRIPVDGKLVVAKTRDGGLSFEVIRRGLPQEHAYHLVYRHALNVAPTGRELAMGSTTGALFVSDDTGDSWRALSHHLPPIACVRFG